MSYRYAHFGLGKKKDIEVKPVPHHKCSGCGCPIYDMKPVCVLCFRAGKFPRNRWRKNTPVVEVKKRRTLQKSSKDLHQSNWQKRLKRIRDKKKKPLTENQLLSRLGTFAYYQLQRNKQHPPMS